MIGSNASAMPMTLASPGVSNVTTSAPSRGGGASSVGSVVWWLVLLGLYVVWAVVHEHEGVQKSLQPSNIRVNLHNLLVIALGVVIALPLAKFFLAKVTVWIPGLQPLSKPLLEVVDAS